MNIFTFFPILQIALSSTLPHEKIMAKHSEKALEYCSSVQLCLYHHHIQHESHLQLNPLLLPEVGLYTPVTDTCQYSEIRLRDRYSSATGRLSYTDRIGAQTQPWVLVHHSSSRWSACHHIDTIQNQ